MDPKKRVVYLFEQYQLAYKKLQEIYKLEDQNDELVRDAGIKRFEFTLELAWKIMQTILKAKGIEVYGSRDVVREAAKVGLIEAPEKWLAFLDGRNVTVHEYGLEKANKIYPLGEELANEAEKLTPRIQEFLATPN